MSSSQEPLWWVAGGFALAASLVSLGQMIAHIKWNNHIKLRTYILRILLMVPVYSLEAFFGLRYVTAGLYFDVLRECYEALVIYSFFLFLVEFMGGQSAVIRMLASKPQHDHYAPCCCLSRWEMGSQFYFQIQLGTLQYVVIKPILACITFILNNTGNYTDGLFHLDDGYVYITFINNCSQIWAMYCLILFYLVVKDELAPVKPIPKFLIVKSVVFFTFWQSVLLAILVRLDLIQSSGGLSTDNVVKGIQDFLVCIEMFFAAIAHHYAFPYDEFYDPARTATGPRMIRSFLQVVNVTDVYVDHVRQMVRRKDHINPSEETRSENQHIELLSSNAIDSSSSAALDKSPITNGHSSSSPSSSPKLVHRTHLKDRSSNLLSPTAVDAPTIEEDDSTDADLRRMTSAASNRINLQQGTPLQTLSRANERQEAAQQYASLPVLGGSLSPNRDQVSMGGGSPASLLSVIPMSLRGKASEHAHVPLSSAEEDADDLEDGSAAAKSHSKSKGSKSKRTKPSSSVERTLISVEDSDGEDEERGTDDAKQDGRSSKGGKASSSSASSTAHKKKGRGASSKPSGPLPPLSVEVKRGRGHETTSITVMGAGGGLDPSLLEPNSSRSRCSSRDTRPTDDEQDDVELSRQSSGLSLHLADDGQDLEANSPQGSASEHEARGNLSTLQSREAGGWLSRQMHLGPGGGSGSHNPSRSRSPQSDDDEPLLENR